MTVGWLVVWLASDTPDVEQWNAWLVSLGVCAFIDWIGLGT